VASAILLTKERIPNTCAKPSRPPSSVVLRTQLEQLHMRLSVRPLTESDITAAAALAADVFRFAYGAAFSDSARFEQYLVETFDPETFASQMSFESDKCLVGHVDDELAGFLKLAASKPLPGIAVASCVELAKLYVWDQFHGTGIALALLKSALHAAAGSGFDVVWLCVWERNPRALAFYRKSGFEVVGEVVIPMNGVPFRDLVMQARVT
jgi:ribosomal protein S18 acetylase RimI-like enzyme